MIKFFKTYYKTIAFSTLLLVVSLIKLPSADDILNMFWVDVVPIYPTIENSIVSISNTPNVDKYEHAIFYAILSFLLFLEMPKKWKFYRYLINFVYCFSFGAIIEIVQGFTPNRTTNIMDCLANSLGTIIALILIFILSYFYERKRTKISNCLNTIKGHRLRRSKKNS